MALSNLCPHLLLPLLALPALAAAAPPAIVQKAIDHHGGALYEQSETELELCSKSGCYSIRARLDGGLFEYDVASDERRVRSTNDAVEWWQEGVERQPSAEERRRLRDWAMARVYFAFLPYRLADPGVEARDLGVEEWRGRELHKVKVTFAAGSSTDAEDEYLYWFDPESGRLELFAYSYESGGPGLRFRRVFNHRRVGGILFFDQENLGIEGDGLSVDDLTPSFVDERLRSISTVELRDIRVTPLGSDAP